MYIELPKNIPLSMVAWKRSSLFYEEAKLLTISGENPHLFQKYKQIYTRNFTPSNIELTSYEG